MNTKTFHKTFLAIAGLSLVLALQGWAIEAPVDNTPPPVAGNAIPKLKEKPKKEANTAFLGVVTSHIPPMLTAHLGVKPDEGIMIHSIMPDGPATDAGLERYDIITHIGKTPITSPLVLSSEIKKHQPGDTIQLSLIHQGKPAKVKATLAKRPQATAQLGEKPLEQLQLDGISPEMAERMRGMIEDKIQHRNMPQGHAFPSGPDPAIEGTIRQMQRQLRESMAHGKKTLPGNIERSVSFKVIDAEGTIEMNSQNGRKELTVRDLNNEIIWSGPWNTDEDKAAAPADIRERTNKMDFNRFGRIRFQSNIR